MLETKEEILELLRMPYEEFSAAVLPQARAVAMREKQNRITPIAMLGFTNICKNNCLYCGMRAGCVIPRYRIAPEDAVASALSAHKQGIGRVFLIAGEDPKYGFENILKMIAGITAGGMKVSLACGEFSAEEYVQMRQAGADEYVLKFEMSDPATFDRLNPSTSFAHRMRSIAAVQASGMKLASGNIVDFPGHSLGQMADDILLMKKLNISWAPIVPYMPAKNTPLSKEGGRGDYFLNLKEIAILRLMMPQLDITAQQPGADVTQGFAAEDGNLLAVQAGANLLFADLLPAAQARNFSVIDNRLVLGLDHIRKIAALAGASVG